MKTVCVQYTANFLSGLSGVIAASLAHRKAHQEPQRDSVRSSNTRTHWVTVAWVICSRLFLAAGLNALLIANSLIGLSGLTAVRLVDQESPSEGERDRSWHSMVGGIVPMKHIRKSIVPWTLAQRIASGQIGKTGEHVQSHVAMEVDTECA